MLPPPILSPRGTTCISVMTVFWFLAGVFLTLRLYTNCAIRKKITPSDWLVAAAFVILTIHLIFIVLICLYGGIGWHATKIDPVYVENNFKILFGQQIMFGIGLGLIKCSICYLFATIFPITWLRRAAAAIAILSICFTISTILVAFVTCRPLASAWDVNSLYGKCTGFPAAWMAVGCVDVITDTMILILPLPMLAKLRMRISRKCAVGSVFIMGIVTIVIGVVRSYMVYTVNTRDVTYDGYFGLMWSILEPPIAIMVACSMTLRPLYQHCSAKFGLPPLFGGDDDYDNYSYADNYYGRGNYGSTRSNAQGARQLEQIGGAPGHDSQDQLNGLPEIEETDGASTIRASTLTYSRSHSMKFMTNRSSTRQGSDASTVQNHEGTFFVGAGSALPPQEALHPAKSSPPNRCTRQASNASSTHDDGEIFSMGATPALPPQDLKSSQ